MKILAFCDSLCEPNPGEMHVGYWAKDTANNILFYKHRKVGFGTCNEAEYHALFTIVAALAEQLGKDAWTAHQVTIHSDSQLMTKQINGLWQVTKPEIAALYHRAKRLQDLHGFKVQWIPRENNSIADALAQEERLKGSGRRYQLDDGRLRVHRNTPCVEIFSDREMGRLLHSEQMSQLKEDLEAGIEQSKIDFDRLGSTLMGIRLESQRLRDSLPKLNNLVTDWLTSTFAQLDQSMGEFLEQADQRDPALRESVREFFTHLRERDEPAHITPDSREDIAALIAEEA